MFLNLCVTDAAKYPEGIFSFSVQINWFQKLMKVSPS